MDSVALKVVPAAAELGAATVNAADVSVIADVAVLRTSNGTPTVTEDAKPVAVGAGTVLGPQVVLRGRG